jgi:hypothetical protein
MKDGTVDDQNNVFFHFSFGGHFSFSLFAMNGFALSNSYLHYLLCIKSMMHSQLLLVPAHLI